MDELEYIRWKRIEQRTLLTEFWLEDFLAAIRLSGETDKDLDSPVALVL